MRRETRLDAAVRKAVHDVSAFGHPHEVLRLLHAWADQGRVSAKAHALILGYFLLDEGR